MEISFFNVHGSNEDVTCSFLIIEKVLEAFRLKKARLYTKKSPLMTVLYPEVVVDCCIPPFLQQKRRRIDEQSFMKDGHLFLNAWPYQLRNHYVPGGIIGDDTITAIASDLVQIIGSDIKIRHSQVLPRYFHTRHLVISRPQSSFVVLLTPMACDMLIEKSLSIRSLAGLCVPIALVTTQPQKVNLRNVHVIPHSLSDLSSALGICDAVVAGSQLEALFLGCTDREDPLHTIVIGESRQKFLLAESFISQNTASESDLVRIFMKLRR